MLLFLSRKGKGLLHVIIVDFFNTKQRLIWDPGRKVQGEPQRGTAQGEGVPWAHEGLEGITIPQRSAKSERNFNLECNNWMPGQPMGKLGKQWMEKLKSWREELVTRFWNRPTQVTGG